MMLSLLCGLWCFLALNCGQQVTRGQPDDGRRFICRAVPRTAGPPGCGVTLLPEPGAAAGAQEEELRNTVMQLRETISLQKETIGKQLGTINELTTKLSLCDGRSGARGAGGGPAAGTRDKQNTMGDVPRGGDPTGTIESLGRTMQGLKDRLESLEQQQMRANSSGTPFPSGLRELLQRRLVELEEQLLRKVHHLETEKTELSNATTAYRLKTQSTLLALVERISELEKGGGDFRSPEQFKLSLPQRTNYLYGRMTPELPELYAFTVAQLPLSVRDARWHHVCVSWTTRDGQWEAFQDGLSVGSGDNLAAWHPIKPGGVIILGQEQVRRDPPNHICSVNICRISAL
ncbi:hypothetical protein CRUP_016844 [Coryphaenoides rupestris]|nr:hypothetical protein CRUP_016844 [Coryphaenoides rupestris]